MGLNERIAVVTGARRGLGLAIAKALEERGARVVGTSRALAGFGDPFARGSTVVGAPLDVRRESSVKALFHWVRESYGRLDILVNNAGINLECRLADMDLGQWHEVLETNLTGAFLCMREAARLMHPERGGVIVQIGSVAAEHPLVAQGAYGASKAGLALLSGVARAELRTRQVRVMHVVLGATATEIWNERPGFDARDMLSPQSVAGQIAGAIDAQPDVIPQRLVLMPPKGIL